MKLFYNHIYYSQIRVLVISVTSSHLVHFYYNYGLLPAVCVHAYNIYTYIIIYNYVYIKFALVTSEVFTKFIYYPAIVSLHEIVILEYPVEKGNLHFILERDVSLK